jgi:hypothetical protein
MAEANKKPSQDKGYTVVAEVISRQGTCDFAHEVGDRVVFEIRRIRE